MGFHRNGRSYRVEAAGANWVTAALFAIYLGAVFWILLFKTGIEFAYMDERLVNLVPFHYAPVTSTLNILNAMVFVPLGIYAEILSPNWSFLKKALSLFLISLSIEALQYILAVGALDITDLITNTAGGIIGLVIGKLIAMGFNDGERTRKWINIFGAAGTVLLGLFLLLLKLDLLPFRYR